MADFFGERESLWGEGAEHGNRFLNRGLISLGRRKFVLERGPGGNFGEENILIFFPGKGLPSFETHFALEKTKEFPETPKLKFIKKRSKWRAAT